MGLIAKTITEKRKSALKQFETEANTIGRSLFLKKDKKTAHHNAQVFFTTQQKFFRVSHHQKNFTKSGFFKYRDVPRQVRIWDEAILPAEPVLLTVHDIKKYVRLLKGHDETRAAAALDEWVKRLPNIPSGAVVRVPDFPLKMAFPPEPREDHDEDDDHSEKGRDLYDSDLARIMYFLAWRDVRVYRDAHSGMTAISYRESLPKEFAPLLILDASGELRQTYKAWGEGRGNLIEFYWWRVLRVTGTICWTQLHFRRLHCAGNAGATANVKLTFHPGHSMGPINSTAFGRVAAAMSEGEGVLQ